MWNARLFSGRSEIASLIKLTDGGGEVVSFTPRHPIFARDATDLSQSWQWLEYLGKDQVRSRLKNIVDEITASRPALITSGELPLDPGEAPHSARVVYLTFTVVLKQYGVISESDAERLQTFLDHDYRFVRIGRYWYWVRKDLAVPNV